MYSDVRNCINLCSSVQCCAELCVTVGNRAERSMHCIGEECRYKVCDSQLCCFPVSAEWAYKDLFTNARHTVVQCVVQWYILEFSAGKLGALLPNEVICLTVQPCIIFCSKVLWSQTMCQVV